MRPYGQSLRACIRVHTEVPCSEKCSIYVFREVVHHCEAGDNPAIDATHGFHVPSITSDGDIGCHTDAASRLSAEIELAEGTFPVT